MSGNQHASRLRKEVIGDPRAHAETIAKTDMAALGSIVSGAEGAEQGVSSGSVLRLVLWRF